MATKTKTTTRKSEIMNKPETKPEVFTSAEKETYKKLKREIRSELSKVEKSYLVMAFKVHYVYTCKLFSIDGHKTIYEWAANEFKLARGTTNNYINICEKFGKIEDDGTCNNLLPQYASFTSSQLILMLSMNDEVRNLITSDMTIKQIKQKKKEQASDGSSNEKSESEEKSDNEDEEKNAKITDNLLCIMQLASADDFSETNLKTISDVFTEFQKKHKNINPRISIDIRWTK